MARTSLQRVKEVFQEARDVPEPDRNGFVAAACGEDDALRAEVEALLAADDAAGAFLAAPTMDGASDAQRLDASEVFDRLQRALAGRFSLEYELGRGGMGIVYLARDVALDRPVAIKLLPPELAAVPESRERFLREARTAAGLSHPNIVPIHLVEEKDDLVYFVMAFVDGESLGDRVRRAGPMKAADAAKLVQEVSWALAYAHGRGVIHRDIKPDNILIDGGSGRALVTDFGIARVTTAETVSQRGDVLGTLQYMSPEQASGSGTIDGRADLYSLGVTAFFALSGRLPFESPNPVALVAMHVTEPAPPLTSVSATVPARLAETVDRCLAKDPNTRFESGEALAEAIADAQLTRREIAPSVREFLSAAKFGTAQAIILGALWMFLGAEPLAETGMLGTIMLVSLTLVTPLILIHPLLAARGVIRAGLNQHDVAEAAASSGTTRDANVEFEVARSKYVADRLSRIWVRLPLLGAAAAALSYLPDVIADVPLDPVSLPALSWLLFVLLMAGGEAFALSVVIAPHKTVAILTRGTPENAGVLRKLWGGRLGRWFFKLAGIGLAKGKALPPPDAAPTEVVLGRATTALYEQLPREQRERLGDVQEVIGGLERAATTLRNRRDELAKAMADIGEAGATARRGAVVAELQTAKAAVDDRLATAVSALENLRLDLLRLRAGVGHPDDLTAAIEEARVVGEAVDVQLAAHQEVESLTARETDGGR